MEESQDRDKQIWIVDDPMGIYNCRVPLTGATFTVKSVTYTCNYGTISGEFFSLAPQDE